jgi:hypothetical protein
MMGTEDIGPAILSVQTDGVTAKLVDVLATNQGISRSDWLRKVITNAVREQSVTMLAKQIKEAA